MSRTITPVPIRDIVFKNISLNDSSQAPARPTVVPPRTVATSQLATVASPRRNAVAPPAIASPSIYQYIYSKLFS